MHSPTALPYLLTILKPDEDPWFTVARSDIDVDLEFDFHANVLNSSKQARQQGLQAILPIYVSEPVIQMGISTPDTMYRLLKDIGEAFGQDAAKYLNPPTPLAQQSPITAAEAMLHLKDGVFPGDTSPAEGATLHVASLQEIMATPLFEAGFPPENFQLLKSYLDRMVALSQQEQQAQALAASAGPIGQELGPGNGQGNGAAPGSPGGQAPLQENELSDEQLPGAGGGAN